MTTGRAARIGAAAIALGSAIFAVLSLPHAGVTIDEPALLYAGDRTAHALAHPGQAAALDFDGADPPGFHSHFPRLPDALDPEHYPVLPALGAAVINASLGRALRLGPADGHHLGLALLSIALLFLYGRYACRLLGTTAGLAAAIALACFPTAIGHSLNDPKDWPCAGFYALTVLAAGVGLIERRPRQIWIAGLFLGLALSCKQNGLFAAVTVALALPFAYRSLYRGEAGARRLVVPLLMFPYVGVALFVLLWPYLWWAGPVAAGERLGAFIGFARFASTSARAGLTAHPLRCLLFMTPPVVLLAAAAGCWPGRAASGERKTIGALLIIWLLLPLARIARPHAMFYDANRHFIEYVPALCALAGLGFAETCARLRPRLRVGVSVAAAAALMAPIAAYHPFEVAYFNVLAGGLGGAQRDGLFRVSPPASFSNGTEGDYWSSGLRDGVRDARPLLPAGAALGVCAWQPVLAALDSDPPVATTTDVESPATPVVLVSPREGRCGWRRVHELERWRPVLTRVTRGGGLIYEVLGAREPTPHAPVSPPTAYDGP